MTVNAWHHASESGVSSLRGGSRGEVLLSDLDTEDVGETGIVAHRRFLHGIRIGLEHVSVNWQRFISRRPNAQEVVALLWCLIDSEWLVVVLLEVTVSEGVLTLEDLVVILHLPTNTR